MKAAQPVFRKFVRFHAEPTTVYRRDSTTSSSYGEDITYTELNNKRNILVIGTEEIQQPTEGGARQKGRLMAYTSSSVDLQIDDRFDHGDIRYEVDTKEGKPNDSDPAIYRYGLIDV